MRGETALLLDYSIRLFHGGVWELSEFINFTENLRAEWISIGEKSYD